MVLLGYNNSRAIADLFKLLHPVSWARQMVRSVTNSNYTFAWGSRETEGSAGVVWKYSMNIFSPIVFYQGISTVMNGTNYYSIPFV